MSQRTCTMRGTRFPLIGPELHPGDPAPDFRLVQRSAEGLKDVTLADFAGKTLILSVVPSLDTPVCEIQTVRFNDEVGSLPVDAEVLTVSMDLPFAQARFCSDKGTHRIQTASDHRDGRFGEAYGTLIEPLRLECRAAFVVGPDRTIRYAEYVPEITDQPNYDAVVASARETCG
ncbi:MAG: thiol peroxidase [Chthonomonadales bacterium]|nr:thiol peroxidase [Chthonomonadales bacterium]